MDIKLQRKEDSVELARELLIAISHSVPDKVVLNSSNGWVYENGHCNGFVKRDSDELEDIRSELISISTGKSPEKIKLPAVGI